MATSSYPPTWMNQFTILEIKMELAYPPLPKTHDAGKWSNSNSTHSGQLFNALCFVIEQGWGPEAIQPFIDGIMPPAGWDEDPKHRNPVAVTNNDLNRRRGRRAYSPDALALMDGYWIAPEKSDE